MKCPNCGHDVSPNAVVFDHEVIVTIDDEAVFNEIKSKISEDWFEIPSSIDLENLPTTTVERFKKYLWEQTDLIVQHDKHDCLLAWSW